MSGGSDSSAEARIRERLNKNKSNEPAPATGSGTYQQPSFMPGMDTMIAQQLAQGGYGDMNSLLASFAPIFTPMTMPDYRPGAAPVPSPSPSTPTTPSTRRDREDDDRRGFLANVSDSRVRQMFR